MSRFEAFAEFIGLPLNEWQKNIGSRLGDGSLHIFKKRCVGATTLGAIYAAWRASQGFGTIIITPNYELSRMTGNLVHKMASHSRDLINVESSPLVRDNFFRGNQIDDITVIFDEINHIDPAVVGDVMKTAPHTTKNAVAEFIAFETLSEPAEVFHQFTGLNRGYV